MSYSHHIVRPLSIVDEAANQTSNSRVFAVGEPLETYLGARVVEVSGSPSITVQAQHSSDEVAWADIPDLKLTLTGAGYSEAIVTTSVLPFIRVSIVNSVGSSSAVLEIQLLSKGVLDSPGPQLAGAAGQGIEGEP
ncbi:MAG: hypothetical protein ACE5F1_15975 [Planctomycetota bacterium]